ncbi:MAG TPA: hypothetical protein VGV14_04115, partial [Rhodanobacter sp.]|nr:hypothetical protein [Rhodanobacter sp.]
MTFSVNDAVGFSNAVYSPLPVKDPITGKYNPPKITINDIDYTVVDVSPPNNVGYMGMILYDPKSNTVVVANRGTQGGTDAFVDAGMAFTDVNLQWPLASALAQKAQNIAATTHASVIAVGHSLGGTLTQLQCATYGFTGYTFNAYGAAQVFGNSALNPSARIYNYRTMFDLVSDGSTQIGDPEITIETQADQQFVARQSIFGTTALTADLVPLILQNHSLKNFWGSDSAVGTYDGKYTQAINYLPNPRSPAAQGLVDEEEQIVRIVANLVRASLSAAAGNPVQSGDLSYEQSAEFLVEEIAGNDLGGIKAIMPTDPNLLANALNPSSADNSYRYSLANLSPVVLQGLDISGLGNYALWAPGSTTGLTSDYLSARNSMVQTELQFAYAGVPAGGSMNVPEDFTWIYSDLSKSANPLFTQAGI